MHFPTCTVYAAFERISSFEDHELKTAIVNKDSRLQQYDQNGRNATTKLRLTGRALDAPDKLRFQSSDGRCGAASFKNKTKCKNWRKCKFNGGR